MPKYLMQGSYTAEGLRGLLKDGGTKRRQVVEDITKQMGGKLEAFYIAYGHNDFYIIVDMPDSQTITATSLAVNSSGAVKFTTTPLITPEEVDQAVSKGQSIAYQAPGR
jgi:uncharacterized protein with GYD domain